MGKISTYHSLREVQHLQLPGRRDVRPRGPHNLPDGRHRTRRRHRIAASHQTLSSRPGALGHILRPPGIVELHAHPTRSESSILTFNMIELPAPPARTHTDVPPPRADHNFCAHPQAHQLATRHPPE